MGDPSSYLSLAASREFPAAEITEYECLTEGTYSKSVQKVLLSPWTRYSCSNKELCYTENMAAFLGSASRGKQ